MAVDEHHDCPRGLLLVYSPASKGRGNRVGMSENKNTTAGGGTMVPAGASVSGPVDSSETIPGVYQFVQTILYRRSLYNVRCDGAEALFDAIDKDKDCIISGIELYGAAKRLGLGLAEEQINLVMLEMGVPEGFQGHITKAEFIAFFDSELERLKQEKKSNKDRESQSQSLVEKSEKGYTDTHKRLLHPAITLGYEQFRNAPDLQEREEAKLLGGSYHDRYYNRETHTSTTNHKDTSEMQRQSYKYYSRLQNPGEYAKDQQQHYPEEKAEVDGVKGATRTAEQDLDEASKFIQQARLWRHTSTSAGLNNTGTNGRETGTGSNFLGISTTHNGTSGSSQLHHGHSSQAPYNADQEWQQHEEGDHSSTQELSALKKKVQFLEKALEAQENQCTGSADTTAHHNGHRPEYSRGFQGRTQQHSNHLENLETATTSLENMTAEELEQTRHDLYYLQQQVMQMANDARDAVSDLTEKRNNFEQEKDAFEKYRAQLEREASYLEEEQREVKQKKQELSEREQIAQSHHCYEIERLEKALEETRQSRDKALNAARSKIGSMSKHARPENSVNECLCLAFARLYMLSYGRLSSGNDLSTLLYGVVSEQSGHCVPQFQPDPNGLRLELEFSDFADTKATMPAVHSYCRLVSYEPEEIALPLFAPSDAPATETRLSLFQNSNRVHVSSVGDKYIDIRLPIQGHSVRASVEQLLVGPSDTAPTRSNGGHTPRGIYEMLNCTARKVFCGGESSVVIAPTIETCQAIIGEIHCGVLQAMFEGSENACRVLKQVNEQAALGRHGPCADASLMLRVAYVDVRPVRSDNGHETAAFEVRDLLSTDAAGAAVAVSETGSSGWLDMVHFEIVSDLHAALSLVEQAYRTRFEINTAHFVHANRDGNGAHPAAGLFSHGILVTELVSTTSTSEPEQDDASVSNKSDNSLCEIASMIKLEPNSKQTYKTLGRHYVVEVGTLLDAKYGRIAPGASHPNTSYGRSNADVPQKSPTVTCHIPQRLKHGVSASMTKLLTRKSLTFRELSECASIFFGKLQVPQDIAGITGLSSECITAWYGKGGTGEHRAIRHLTMVFPEESIEQHTRKRRASASSTEKYNARNVSSSTNSAAVAAGWQDSSHADRYLMRRRGYLNGPQKRAYEQGGQLVPPDRGAVKKGIEKMQHASSLSPAKFAAYTVKSGGDKIHPSQSTRRSQRRNSVEDKLAELSFAEHSVTSTRNNASQESQQNISSTASGNETATQDWNPVPGMHQFLDMLLQGRHSESQDPLQFIMERIDFLYSFLQDNAGEREGDTTRVTGAVFAKGLVKVLPTISINAAFSYMLPLLHVQPNQHVDFRDFCEAVADLAYHRFSGNFSSPAQERNDSNVNSSIDDHVNELCGLDEILAQEQEALQTERRSSC
eukprot:gb/GECG01002048.1/.p1 GENE.gb/GECG01002048.1/~~gb/GECG01002048.1/.p1  ORF type:complete len:1395 (+),score=200.98 gb/GECG01002048.1/:1-4185(+)